MNNFTMISNDIIRNPNLTPHEKSVLGVILSFNPSYPSYSQIAEYSGMSESKAKKVVKGLVQQKALTYIKGKSRVGKWNNEYTVNTSSQWTLAPLNTKNGKMKIEKSTSKSPVATSSGIQSTPTYNNIKNNKTNVEASTVVATTCLSSSNLESSNKDSKLNNTGISESKNAVTDVCSKNLTLGNFQNHCKYLGPECSETQEYFSELIKSDYYHRIGFIEVEELIAEATNFDAQVIEGYRQLFCEARKAQSQVGAHEFQ